MIMTCAELVELVTAYLDGALDEPSTTAFVEHLDRCPPCRIWLEQFRQVTGMLAREARPETLPAEQKARLLAAFREYG